MIAQISPILLTAGAAATEAPVPAWVVWVLVGGYLPCAAAIIKLYLDLQKSQKGRLTSLKRMKNLLGTTGDSDDDDE